MNMKPPMAKSRYQSVVEKLHLSYQSVAQESMKLAGEECYELTKSKEEVRNCKVLIDGTWQRRGFSSLNGAVTAISPDNGKCLDVHVLSKICKSCQHWIKQRNHPLFDKWEAEHICQINHSKSSGSMESTGAVAIFHRSKELHNLQYTEYIGDGDSSSYIAVQKSNPYGDVEIIKKECIGHVQKRIGTRCRALCKSLKGQKLSDGKGISGKGRLSNKAINTLQNFYGMAIH